jgi:hypothetical protein
MGTWSSYCLNGIISFTALMEAGGCNEMAS